MALALAQPGIEPLGQFDGYYLDLLNFVGGEVCTLIAVSTASQTGPADSADGYLYGGSLVPAATKSQLTNTATAAAIAAQPLFLADDGTATLSGTVSVGYGTLFGTVVGGTVGQGQLGSGPVLGPASQVGSGRITLWDKPGVYKVSLDACALSPSSSTLTTGTKLYAESGAAANPGFITATAGANTVGGAGGSTAQVIGQFIEFETNRALVTTPNRLVAALNSPSSNPAVSLTQKLQFAVFKFDPQLVIA